MSDSLSSLSATLFRYVINIFVLVPIISVFYVLFYIKRLIVYGMLKIKYGSRITLMSGTDSFMAEDFPESRFILTGLAVLDGSITQEFIRESIRKKVESEKEIDKDAKKMLKIAYKRFGYWFWLESSEPFDSHFHIRTLEDIPSNNDQPITERDVERWVSDISNRKFQEGKPNWELLYIPNPFIYEHELNLDKSSIPLRRSCIVRCHHHYGDGASIFSNFFFNFFDRKIFLPPILKIPKLTLLQKLILFFPSLSYLSKVMVIFLENDKNAIHGERLSGEKICAVSKEFKLEDIREIKRKLKMSVSAVLIASLYESIYRYFERKNFDIPTSFRTAFSIPLRFPDEDDTRIENQISFLIFRVPFGKMPILERLRITNDIFQREANSPFVFSAEGLLKILRNVYPGYFFSSLTYEGPVTTVVTNFPLPEKSLEMPFELITDVIPWMPNKHMSGVSVIFFSFSGKFRMTLQTDKKLFPTRDDVTDLMEAWNNTIEELLQIANNKSL